MAERISVVVPVFNDGRTLPGALASLQAQSRAPDEVIVVDDGSTDAGTLALLRDLERIPPLPGLRVVHRQNGGLFAARHTGIDEATGTLLLPLDADDELLPRSLERLEQALAAHPEADFAHGPVRYFGAVRGEAVPPRFNPYLELDENPLLPVALFRMRVFRELGLRYAPLRAFEDWGLWLACARAGLRGTDVREPVYRYRRKGTEGLLAWAEQRRPELEAALRELFPELYAPAARAALKREHAPALELAGEVDVAEVHALCARQGLTDVRVRPPFHSARALLDEARGRFVWLAEPRQLRALLQARPETLLQLQLGLEAHPEASILRLALDVPTLTEGVLELRALPCPRDRTQDDLLLLRTSAFAGLRRAHLADDAPARALVDRATSRGEALLVREDFCGLLRGATLPERRAEAPPPAPEPLWQRPLTQAGPLWKRVRRRLERQLGADRVGRFLHPVKEAVTEAALNVDAARTAVSLRQNPLALGSILSPCARAERAWIEKLPVPLDGPPPTAYATPPTAHATPPTPFATPPTATFAPRTLDTRSPITAPGKPRLVLSLPWVVPGGVDKAAIEQAQWLHEDGHEVLLATHNATAHLWLPKLSPFLREHALLGELCTEERKADALVAFTRRFDARALLMSHSWIGLDALPKLKAGLPRVRTADFVHMEDPRPGAQYAQVASEKFDRFLDLRLVAHAFARRRLVDWGVPESKIRTIHLGCDELGTCDPARTPTGHLRGALGLPIPQGAKVVGFVGRFAEEKDPLLLVRTYAALSASAIAAGLPAPHFVMVGDGPLKAPARAKADECGIAAQTHFLPADADVPRVLRDLSLVLMAGRLEGLPLVFFEALSLGTPVVTTDIQGIPELVDDAVGACVPHGSDETVRLRSLVEAALPLLRDDALRAAKGQAGRARVLAHFSTAQRKEKFRAAMAELVR